MAQAAGRRSASASARRLAFELDLGPVAATSANLHGGPDPRRLADVPTAIRASCAAEIDGGELPGTPSTVLDLTGAEPRVLRTGAGDPAVVARLRAAAHEMRSPR